MIFIALKEGKKKKKRRRKKLEGYKLNVALHDMRYEN